MKELSIEEKAKAYDKLIERLKDFQFEHRQSPFSVALGNKFPELEESEDEKIKKELLSFLKEGKPYYCPNSVKRQEWAAWIEKQGENAYNKELSELLHKVICRFINDPDIPYSDREKVSMKVLPYVERLEKQGEQKPAEEYNITGIGSKNAQGKLGEMIKNLKPVNEVSEQKPADKVEPKFHEGEWIITNKNHIWYVDETPETTSYLYRLINQYGNVEVAEFEIVDKKARLWTIQDAKNGDVLADDVGVILYRKIGNEMYPDVVDYHCVCVARSERFEIQKKVAYWGRLEDTKLYPTTKEQRDLLFQKMKEAGYEWDANKKELKKIEQPPVWGKDDITRINEIIETLNIVQANRVRTQRMHYNKATIDKNIDWLKSLKDRVGWEANCTTTWKPSKKQMQFLLKYAEQSNYDGVILTSLYKDLKKLKGE